MFELNETKGLHANNQILPQMKKRLFFSGASGCRKYHTSGEAVLIGGNLSWECCSSARISFTGGQLGKEASTPKQFCPGGDYDDEQ